MHRHCHPVTAICFALALLLTLGSCSGAQFLNAGIPREGYTVVRDVAYGDGARQKLDVYVPSAPAPSAPVIVFFYGGSWQMGNKQDYLFVGQAFASLGYYTVIADYRLYPEVYFPAFVEDSAHAFRFVHDHIHEYGGNPDNLFLAGHSAGAFNAVMLAADSRYLRNAGAREEWVRGVIGLAGPYDFLPMTDPEIIALFSRVEAKLTQPIQYVNGKKPPMLLLTGDADEEVFPHNTKNLAARLRSFGSQVAVTTYPGVAHIGIVLALAEGFRGKAPVLQDIERFVETSVKH